MKKGPDSEFDNPRNKPVFGKKPGVGMREYPSKDKTAAAGKEVKENPPAILAHTARKFGRARARKQKTAIILSKARRGKG